MHDELIERRLRAALDQEAAALPFTITAAELERRLALRRRSFAGRRLTLLLAAAVGIGLVGVGGALSGLFDQKVPAPTPGPSSPVAVVESERPLPTGPVELPTLDELIASDPGGVVLAQSHGPADAWGLPVEGQPPSSVNLGILDAGASATYLVSVACTDSAALRLDLREPQSPSGPPNGPQIPCDGGVHDQAFEAFRKELRFSADGGASWRIVVRGPRQQPSGNVDPGQLLQPEPGEDEMTNFSGVLSAEAQPFGEYGQVLQNVGGLLTREAYTMQVRCAAGDSFRVIFGSDFDEGRAIGEETQLACDGGVHVIRESILEPYGGQVYVAGKAGSSLDLLITGPTPPIELVDKVPGWTLQSGTGPNFSFDGTGSGFTGPGIQGGGTVLVEMTCTGTQSIENTVEVGPKIGDRQESFIADCAPDGQTTGQSFLVAGDYVEVFFEESQPLTWTALSILVPDDGG